MSLETTESLMSSPRLSTTPPPTFRDDFLNTIDTIYDEETQYPEEPLADIYSDIEPSFPLFKLNPPWKLEYSSPDEAQTEMNQFAATQGYAVVSKRSKSSNGVKLKVIYQCWRGGEYCDRRTIGLDAEKRRRGRTKKCNCPFEVILRRHGDIWLLEIGNGSHNHTPSPAVNIPYLRQMAMKKRGLEIEQAIQQGLWPRQITDQLRNEGEHVIAKNIYNIKMDLNKRRLGGRSSIQTLLQDLPNSGDWCIRCRSDNNDILLALFAIHRTSIGFLRLFPYILWMDTTFKTNKFKMPLLDITGMTSTNQTFSAGFCFLSDSTTDSFCWALQQLQSVLAVESIPEPLTVFTDKELAILSAIPMVFTLNHMLCLWHINKCILAHARTPIRQYLEWEIKEAAKKQEIFSLKNGCIRQEKLHRWWRMKQFWHEIVTALTPQDFEQKWQEFQQTYCHEIFSKLIRYIQKEWLNPIYAKMFLHHYTRHYFHFGEVATSRNESAHWAFKRDQQRISLEAIRRLEKEINTYLPIHIEKPQIPIFCVCGKGRGIPCIHQIIPYYNEKKPLPLDLFHLQWHLQEADSPQFHPDLLRIQEPRIRDDRRVWISRGSYTASQASVATSQASGARQDPRGPEGSQGRIPSLWEQLDAVEDAVDREFYEQWSQQGSQQPPTVQSRRRPNTCGNCGVEGHKRPGCPLINRFAS
ncbi:hypothetical protein N7478_007160 [Penicillium angulare]|uniref:uncharacterized protein n=1 Tax=Penicillium angulare TaxID=116970 RepID=UPI00253FB070|nr:uncharacterized protein N7478_004600 [Penicillium angulare]XP_056779514.1 uncharacterized protein N7478_005263 [Penicillium angulare]XP_056781411.1 uncharacterized protein N7478_007160 [Penicillium angulare]KAJ5279228.1 hypothetical protein N7478_004600 [Penicillium angulare]KAJ5279891.1 hypothetical protein N7478_005263 [Penicillium angulare]KAJ5281788.1 hypothetical protein N7478_007160 [Penicillium angulare]